VMHASRLERIDERSHDVFLARQFTEIARTPFASEGKIGHCLRGLQCRQRRGALYMADWPTGQLSAGPGREFGQD
jgi:hypothetical protein